MYLHIDLANQVQERIDALKDNGVLIAEVIGVQKNSGNFNYAYLRAFQDTVVKVSAFPVMKFHIMTSGRVECVIPWFIIIFKQV